MDFRDKVTVSDQRQLQSASYLTLSGEKWRALSYKHCLHLNIQAARETHLSFERTAVEEIAMHVIQRDYPSRVPDTAPLYEPIRQGFDWRVTSKPPPLGGNGCHSVWLQ